MQKPQTAGTLTIQRDAGGPTTLIVWIASTDEVKSIVDDWARAHRLEVDTDGGWVQRYQKDDPSLPRIFIRTHGNDVDISENRGAFPAEKSPACVYPDE